MQAGAAAVVGNERITTSQLNTDTQEYIAALKRAKLDESALGGVPASHIVLQRLVNVAASRQLIERYRVQVTQSEIDTALKNPGQFQSPEINLLASGVSPADAEDYGRVLVGLTKLQQQFGGESGRERLGKELGAIKPIFNPRYGALNPQPSQENPSVFVDTGRFGKLAPQQQQQPPQQQG
jgi:peptidyl-prolyl cis-trans isomerase SurA